MNLTQMWAEADRKETDWRTQGEVVLLEKMHDAYRGLITLGWKEIIYCPKDGSRFLALETSSTGAYPCSYRGEWPDGAWWTEAHGDLWPSHPILWKPLPTDGTAQLSGATIRCEVVKENK